MDQVEELGSGKDSVFLVYHYIAKCLINAFWREKEKKVREEERKEFFKSLSFELRALLDYFSNIFVFTTSSIVPGTQ